MKRFMTFMAAFCGLTSFVASPAFAATTVSTEAELKAAVAAGGDIVLESDIALTDVLEIAEGKTVTLDLAGKAITVPDTTPHIYAIWNYGTVTIKDSVGTGSISARGVYNYTTTANMTITGGHFVNLDSDGGAAVFNKGTLTITAGDFDGACAALNSKSGDVTIDGGTFSGSSAGYAIQNTGDMTINNATVDAGFGAIAVYGGIMVIKNGTFRPTGVAAKTCNVVFIAEDATSVTINDGIFEMSPLEGATPDSGAAVLVSGSVPLTIDAGSFIGMNGMVSGNAKTTINGGAYATIFDYNHYGSLEGYVTVDSIVTVGGKTYTKTEGGLVEVSYVAKIGDKTYETLADALAAAKSGDTIELLDNAAVSGTAQIPAGVTIKSNGNTINGEIRMLGDLTLDGPLTITGGLWVGVKDAMLTATLSGDKLTASYFMFQRGTYTINADIEAVHGYLSFEGTFEVNSTITTTNTNGEPLYLRGTINLNSGAAFNIEYLRLDNANSVLNVKEGASITASGSVSLTKAGAQLYSAGNISGTISKIDGTTIAITGGTYNTDPTAYLAVGYAANANTDGTWTVNATGEALIGTVIYDTLAEALAAAQAGETITLLRDVTASEIITINKAITLDGNGKTLTSTAGRAINVATEGNVTIKNLTVNCSDERGINVITKPANLTIENCNITANNYAVNVAGSAGAAQVTISGGAYTGLNVINVAGADADVTIANATINCALNTTAEKYAALCLNMEATNATISVDAATKINVGSTSEVARNGATNGSIKINGVESGSAVVAVIEHGDYYNSFATLAEAVAAAADGDTIKLLGNETTDAVILVGKSITIDGNGKKLTSSATRAIRLTTAGTTVAIQNLNVVNTLPSGTPDVRGISIDNVGNIALTLTNCTVTGSAYAVNVSGGANCTLTINDGAYEGLNVINVRGTHTVAIDGAELTSTYPTGDTYAGACVRFEAACTATIKNTTFNGANAVAISYKTGASTVTEEANTDNTTRHVAKVNGTYYNDLAEAIAAANGETVVLLASGELETPVAANFDLNGWKLKGDFAGTLVMNGGKYYSADDHYMAGPEGYYVTTDATFKFDATSIEIAAGTVSISKDMNTLPGQTLTIAEGVTFTVPAEKTINVLDSTIIVNGTLTINGTVKLGGTYEGKTYTTGTITAAQGLTITSGVDGYDVVCADGTYTLVKSVKITVDGAESDEKKLSPEAAAVLRKIAETEGTSITAVNVPTEAHADAVDGALQVFTDIVTVEDGVATVDWDFGITAIAPNADPAKMDITAKVQKGDATTAGDATAADFADGVTVVLVNAANETDVLGSTTISAADGDGEVIITVALDDLKDKNGKAKTFKAKAKAKAIK